MCMSLPSTFSVQMRWWKRDDKIDAIASSLIFHVAFIGSMFLMYHNATIVHEKLREVERERERERENDEHTRLK